VEGAYRFEGRDLGLPVIRWDVLDSHATVLHQALVGHLRNTFESPIPSFEIESSRPVIREVLAECTCCASRLGGRIMISGIHCGIERVSSNYLMEIR
jgi:hypothetical protein